MLKYIPSILHHYAGLAHPPTLSFFSVVPQNERVKELLNLLKKAPNNQITLFKIATAYKDNLQFNQAIEYYRRALKVKPKFYEAYYNIAKMQEAQNQIQEAIRDYKKVLEINDKHFEAHFRTAKLLFKKDLIQEAIIHYQRALEVNPDFFKIDKKNVQSKIKELSQNYKFMLTQKNGAIAYFNFGVFLSQINNKEQMIKCFQKSLVMDPKFVKAYQALGPSYFDQAQFQKATFYFESLVKLKKNDHDALFNLGVSLEQLKRTQQAKKCYQKIIRNNPGYSQAYNNIGNIFQSEQLHGEAIECFLKTIELQPTNIRAYTNLARVCQRIDQPETAIISYRKAIKMNPAITQLYLDLAQFLCSLAQYRQAIRVLKEGLEFNKNCIVAYYLTGQIYLKLNEVQQAQINYQKFNKAKTDDASELVSLGIKALVKQQFEKATKLLYKSIQIQSNNFKAYLLLGFSLFQMNRIQQSIKIYQRGIEIEPYNDGEIHNELGFALKSIKRYKQAQKQFLKSLEINKGLFLPNFNIAQVYENMGQFNKALVYTQKALEIDDTHSEARAMLTRLESKFNQ